MVALDSLCQYIHNDPAAILRFMNHKAVANSADQVNFSICVCANIKIALIEGNWRGVGGSEGTKNSIQGLQLGKLAVRWRFPIRLNFPGN